MTARASRSRRGPRMSSHGSRASRQDATVLDVGCGTGRVTEALLALVPRGRVLAIDASADMVALARRRLGDRAQVWCQDVLDLDLDEPVDAIVSTATLHWVTDHDRLWARLARALRPGGVLEVQCGGEGNIERRPRGHRGGGPRHRAGAGRLVAVGLRGAAGDGAAPARRGLHRDPVLAGGTPDASRGRGRVRAHVDPAGAPRAPARGAARAVRRRGRGGSARSRWTTCASTSQPCASKKKRRPGESG